MYWNLLSCQAKVLFSLGGKEEKFLLCGPRTTLREGKKEKPSGTNEKAMNSPMFLTQSSIEDPHLPILLTLIQEIGQET